MADSVVARLKILLGIDSAEAVSGAAKTEKAVSKMEKGISSSVKIAKAALGALGAAFTVDAIVRVTKQAIEYTTAIKDQAREVGVTTKSLQEYRYAAMQAGVSSDQLTDGLKELTLKLGEAAGGSKSATALFEEYGISIRDANGEIRDTADVLPDLADAFNKLKSPAEQARLAAAVFGEDAGPKMQALLAQGKQGIDDYRAAAEQLGLVISDAAIEKADEASKKMEALNRVLSAKIATAVADNADAISDLADALSKLIDFAAKGARAWRYFTDLDWSPGAGSFSKQIEAMQLRDLGPGVELTPSAAAAIEARRWGGTGRSSVLSAPRSSNGPQANPWANRVPSLLMRSNATSASAFGGTDWSAFAPGQGGADWIKAAAATREIANDVERADPIFERMAMKSGAELARNVMLASKGLQESARAAQAIMDRLFPEEARQREFSDEMRILQQAYDGGALSAADLARGQAALTKEFIVGMPAVEGIAAGMNKYMRATKDAQKQTEDTNVRIVDSWSRMVDGSLREVDRFVSGIKSGNWLDVIGGLLGAIDGIAGVVTGGKGFSIGDLSFGKGRGSLIPGFASGGSGIIGGFSGIDRNLLSLNGEPMARVSRGERLTISPANDRGGAGAGSNYFDLRGAVMTEDLLRQMNAIAASEVASRAPGIAKAGSSIALSKLGRMQMKALG